MKFIHQFKHHALEKQMEPLQTLAECFAGFSHVICQFIMENNCVPPIRYQRTAGQAQLL